MNIYIIMFITRWKKSCKNTIVIVESVTQDDSNQDDSDLHNTKWSLATLFVQFRKHFVTRIIVNTFVFPKLRNFTHNINKISTHLTPHNSNSRHHKVLATSFRFPNYFHTFFSTFDQTRLSRVAIAPQKSRMLFGKVTETRFERTAPGPRARPQNYIIELSPNHVLRSLPLAACFHQQVPIHFVGCVGYMVLPRRAPYWYRAWVRPETGQKARILEFETNALNIMCSRSFMSFKVYYGVWI